MPTFSILVGTKRPVSVELDSKPEGASAVPSISELQPCGFEVADRELDEEYVVSIGDLQAEQMIREHDLPAGFQRGVALGANYMWAEVPFFESARGVLDVHLASRRTSAGAAFRRRATVQVVVIPGKLGEERYQAMFEQLRGLAGGLVFDVTSKMARGISGGAASRTPTVLSSNVEMRLIERLWREFAPALLAVEQDPVLELSHAYVARACWGGEKLGARSLRSLAARGTDPRRRGGQRPFVALIKTLRESPVTPEHRIILGFLNLLLARVQDCEESIRRHIREIENERPYRDVKLGSEPTLYETVDVPRIRRLQELAQQGEYLEKSIHRATRLWFLKGVAPLEKLPETPVFLNIATYHRVRELIRKYHGLSLVILDQQGSTRIKMTSRMYEQWVFLQLAAAFRKAGLKCGGVSGLWRRARRRRFVVDLERGARIEFSLVGGRSLALRFEPWIFPADVARERNETVYRGQQGDVPWCPDVLIEVLGASGEVEYAAVVDAKYSVRIEERHWEPTSKYLQIRGTRDNRRVVKQLWLSHPGTDTWVKFRDPYLQWTDAGPTVPQGENAEGILPLTPPDAIPKDVDQPGWIAPTAVAVDFARGFLRYLGLDTRAGGKGESASG